MIYRKGVGGVYGAPSLLSRWAVKQNTPLAGAGSPPAPPGKAGIMVLKGGKKGEGAERERRGSEGRVGRYDTFMCG